MTSPVDTTEYEYDPVTGRLTKIVSPEGKEFIFSYDRGQLETLSRLNGIVTHYAFDDNGNLELLDHRLGASSVARYEYTYDRNGMRTSMTDLDGLHDYTYDTLYQIIQATHPTVTNPTESFQYDAAGNRLVDEARAYQYNELNQLTEDDEHLYEYDLDGNMVLKVEKATGDSTKFFWDIENRLVKVEKPGTVAEYVYGPLGRRLTKSVNGTTTEFRYDGEDLILELDDDGNVAASWTFGPGIDQPLAMRRGGENHYYVADGLGSVTALTDEGGAVIQTYKYGVFGEITEQAGNLENPFTYTGREWEPGVGLYYYRARWYEARRGHFLADDPLGFVGGINLRVYVANNPLNFVDPSGLNLKALWDLLDLIRGIMDAQREYKKDKEQFEREWEEAQRENAKRRYEEWKKEDYERRKREGKLTEEEKFLETLGPPKDGDPIERVEDGFNTCDFPIPGGETFQPDVDSSLLFEIRL
jgi:RHS repeat-associated protein